MANRDLDTVGTNSPLAGLESVIRVVLVDTSEHVAGALAGETLPGTLPLCSVGSHALAKTTAGADTNAADLLESQGMHDVTDGSLCAGQGGGGGILRESLDRGGGVVGL